MTADGAGAGVMSHHAGGGRWNASVTNGILLPPCILDVTYLDHCILATEQDWKQAEEIHRILFPAHPFEYDDYCKRSNVNPSARGADHKWRNRVIDTLALWTHIYNGGGGFVTSDDNFHRPTKKSPLTQLGSGDILRPKEAAVKFCPTELDDLDGYEIADCPGHHGAPRHLHVPNLLPTPASCRGTGVQRPRRRRSTCLTLA